MVKHLFFLSFFVAFTVQRLYATHIIGGYISVKKIPEFSNVYEITVTGFRDVQSVVPFGSAGSSISFGDGTSMEGAFENVSIHRVNDRMEIVQFSVRHQYDQTIESYLIEYSEHNRMADIVNMSSSVVSPFYVYTKVNFNELTNETFNEVNFLDLIIHPILVGQNVTGKIYASTPSKEYFNTYELVTPRATKDKDVDDYSFLNAEIDPYTGAFSFNTDIHDLTGGRIAHDEWGYEAIFNVKITQFYHSEGEFVAIGNQVVEFVLTSFDEDILPYDCAPEVYFEPSAGDGCEDAPSIVDLVVKTGSCDSIGQLSITSDVYRIVGQPDSLKTLEVKNDTLIQLELTSDTIHSVDLQANIGFGQGADTDFLYYPDCKLLAALDEFLNKEEEVLAVADPNKFEIYPNPTAGAFSLLSKSAGSIKIYAMDGRMIRQLGVQEDQEVLFNQNAVLPSGVYLVNFYSDSGDEISSKKLIVK